MAAGSNPEEMNPFISYVDLFSSVILVLLLFVLIMFVNVGYYMQFNSKNLPAPVVTQEPSVEVKEETAPKVTFVSFQKPQESNATSASDVGENTLTKAADQSTKVDFKESDFLIVFKNNEYFVNKSDIAHVSKAMERVLKTHPNATFAINVGDSQKLISSTQARQVSLGRVLSLNNSLENIPQLKNKISINYKPNENKQFEYGYLKIDVK